MFLFTPRGVVGVLSRRTLRNAIRFPNVKILILKIMFCVAGGLQPICIFSIPAKNILEKVRSTVHMRPFQPARLLCFSSRSTLAKLFKNKWPLTLQQNSLLHLACAKGVCSKALDILNLFQFHSNTTKFTLTRVRKRKVALSQL